MIEPIVWEDGVLKILDQTLLPNKVEWIVCRDYKDVASCISSMKIRGAPAIGVCAGYGVCMAKNKNDAIFLLSKTRPTGYDLFWVLDRMKEGGDDLLSLAKKIHNEEIERTYKIGEHGFSLLFDGASVLTHCNAGSLACCGVGTALAPIYLAHKKGMKINVFVAETRPRSQGARLTMWELGQAGINATLIADTMIGFVMKKGFIDMVFVGADRVAKNGDLANKIGTYQIAILAKFHDIPFYTFLPSSTIDLDIENGGNIPIEERDKNELGYNFNCINPSFDVTPNHLITGIITENGYFKRND